MCTSVVGAALLGLPFAMGNLGESSSCVSKHIQPLQPLQSWQAGAVM